MGLSLIFWPHLKVFSRFLKQIPGFKNLNNPDEDWGWERWGDEQNGEEFVNE